MDVAMCKQNFICKNRWGGIWVMGQYLSVFRLLGNFETHFSASYFPPRLYFYLVKSQMTISHSIQKQQMAYFCSIHPPLKSFTIAARANLPMPGEATQRAGHCAFISALYMCKSCPSEPWINAHSLLM